DFTDLDRRCAEWRDDALATLRQYAPEQDAFFLDSSGMVFYAGARSADRNRSSTSSRDACGAWARSSGASERPAGTCWEPRRTRHRAAGGDGGGAGPPPPPPHPRG